MKKQIQYLLALQVIFLLSPLAQGGTKHLSSHVAQQARQVVAPNPQPAEIEKIKQECANKLKETMQANLKLASSGIQTAQPATVSTENEKKIEPPTLTLIAKRVNWLTLPAF